MIVVCLALTAVALGQPRLQRVGPVPKVGQPTEYRLVGAPMPERPHDVAPGHLSLVISGPEGAKRLDFYAYQEFSRQLVGEREINAPKGMREWRARWTPLTAGGHTLSVEGSATVAAAKTTVEPGAVEGFLRINPENPRYFMNRDGSPFVPIGMNICWPGTRGTFDYDMWLEPFAASGANYLRIWMCPWAFGMEQAADLLGNYDERALWRLDYVIRRCEQLELRVILCFDYHGMLNEQPDFWGSNDNWKNNPYNANNGGPAANQNAFFTDLEAKRFYRQRLAHLVARYSSSPAIGVWEFWNEIDLMGMYVQPEDVKAWHAEMGEFLAALDPYDHPISTSYSGSGWPDMWQIETLGLTQRHAYGQALPAQSFAAQGNQMVNDYGKPFIVGEFGVDWRGDNTETDPHERGLHQSLWGSLIGGNAGTAQSWWWQMLHERDVYSRFRSIADFIEGSGIGGAGWAPLNLETPGAPQGLTERAEGGTPFTVRLVPSEAWGATGSGIVYLNDAESGQTQATRLNRYVHGSSKADLQRPFEIHAHYLPGSKVRVHVNSASEGGALRLLADGREIWQQPFPNKDGSFEVNGEYDETFEISVPEGTTVVSLENPGADWVNVDWVEVAGVVPGAVSAEGMPVDALGVGTDESMLIWVLDPRAAWPTRATDPTLPTVSGSWVQVLGLSDGAYTIRFYDPEAGSWFAGMQGAESKDGRLRIALPPFEHDLAMRVIREK